jgi:dTDP-glucose 4,6-dehydratase
MGRKVPVYGSGKNIRDWIHVEDHCRAIFAVLKGGKSGEIYNIGGGNEISNIDLTYRILDIMGTEKSEIEFVNDRLGHDSRYSVNAKKIENELHFTPQMDFEGGLESTIDWYRKNRDWWQLLVN